MDSGPTDIPATEAETTDRSAEAVTARVAGAMYVESVIRERTRIVVVGLVVVGLGLLVVGILVDGAVRGLAVVAALVVLGIARGVAVLRRMALARIPRRFGGAEFDLVQPILSRHLPELRQAASSLPRSQWGVLRMLLKARRMSAFQAALRDDAEALARLAPRVVAEVDRALAASSERSG